jgi:hypothetical protein
LPKNDQSQNLGINIWNFHNDFDWLIGFWKTQQPGYIRSRSRIWYDCTRLTDFLEWREATGGGNIEQEHLKREPTGTNEIIH